MLQQTRVEVVAARYERFLQRFPSLTRLAAADEEEVVAEWSGLGYYRRARAVHAAARMIAREHAGRFPADPEAAMGLPGVGRYTAHAVASIAYGVAVAVVDGNVSRVLSRLELLPVRPPALLQREADRLLDPDQPGEANQALMELGATVCLPAQPACTRCPLARSCGARRYGLVESLPESQRRPATKRVDTTLWILRDRKGCFWLERRNEKPLQGLWMFPWRDGRPRKANGRLLGTVNHSIMNRRYRCHVRMLRGKPADLPGRPAGAGEWIERKQIDRLPHPSLVVKALRVLREKG
jgi:A/G-specific adenine glycosylase